MLDPPFETRYLVARIPGSATDGETVRTENRDLTKSHQNQVNIRVPKPATAARSEVEILFRKQKKVRHCTLQHGPLIL
jgi:hypothetical protein